MPERDYIDELEMKVAIAASEDRQRHELASVLKSVKDDLRREIRFTVITAVALGNGVAAWATAKWGVSDATQGAARALRAILPL